MGTGTDYQTEIKLKGGAFTLKNAQILPHGGIKCCGWKTLRGFIRILKQQNKLLTKHNQRVKFEVTLPLPKQGVV